MADWQPVLEKDNYKFRNVEKATGNHFTTFPNHHSNAVYRWVFFFKRNIWRAIITWSDMRERESERDLKKKSIDMTFCWRLNPKCLIFTFQEYFKTFTIQWKTYMHRALTNLLENFFSVFLSCHAEIKMSSRKSWSFFCFFIFIFTFKASVCSALKKKIHRIGNQSCYRCFSCFFFNVTKVRLLFPLESRIGDSFLNYSNSAAG